MNTFDRTTFLGLATALKEDILPSYIPGLDEVPCRELTAAQRLEAAEVATILDAEGNAETLPDGTAKINTALYWAAVIQMSVLDPATCFDETGRFVEGKGQLLLDPADILTLAEQGKDQLRPFAQRILNLSWMTQEDLFRRRQETNDRQRPPGAGDGTADAGPHAEGARDGNDGSALGNGIGGGAGDGTQSDAQSDEQPRVHAGKGARRRH